MSLEVKILYYDDLDKETTGSMPNNGCGRECASYLEVVHNGKRIALVSDAMCPEDATFTRDLRWIKPLLVDVFMLGKESNDADR